MQGYDVEAQRGSVRRNDLRLRADFPHIQTEIYELPHSGHVIFIPKEALNLDDLGKKFAESYVGVTQQLQISNVRPSQGDQVEGIDDLGIGLEIESLTFSRPDIETLLAGCFPHFPPLTSIDSEGGGAMRFSFAEALTAEMEEELRPFVRTLVRGRLAVFDVQSTITPPPAEADPADELKFVTEGSRFRPTSRRPNVPSFVREEEDWWFASLPALFRGELRRELTAFTENAGSACYFQPNAAPQIDLRRALLAYDTVYMEPPAKGKFGEFEERQAVSQEDLLELVAADRVRFLHTRPEEQSDPGFLQEARLSNPNGVIGRRRSAALFVSDLVETANEYVLGKPDLRSDVFEIVKRMAVETGAPIEEVSRLLLGPDHVRRACLQPLVDRGLLSFDVVGTELGTAFERLSGKAVAVEAGYFGSGIHVAHTLDATFIPSWPGGGDFIDSWIPPMKIMGDRLNFYRSANDRIAAAWAANEKRKEERRIVLPPIPIFEMRADVGIGDILRLTSVDRRKGRALITRLSEMPVELREAEIARLIEAVSHLETGQAKAGRGILALDTAMSLGTWYLGINVFPVVPMFTVLNKVLHHARAVPRLEFALDALDRAFGEKLGRNAGLTFLSKVSRVGQIAPARSLDRFNR